MNRLIIVLMLSFCFALHAFSNDNNQKFGGHVGGGDVAASDFQNMINKIDEYLLTKEGKEKFPEIKQPEFHEVVTMVRPVVKDERVTDSFGISQTCISIVEKKERIIQCDLKRLPQLGLDTQPALYRMVFHELLFQAGLELPISKEIPSDFKISSRLKLTLRTSKEWVLGEEKNNKCTDIRCMTSREIREIRNYQVLAQFGVDYKVSTTQVALAKIIDLNSIMAFRIGQRGSSDEKQTNFTLQYKRFLDNSFYFAPEIYYLNFTQDTSWAVFDKSKDRHFTTIGGGIRIGNQWQWKHYTMGVDWVGFGRNIAYFKNVSNNNDYTITLANFYLGWSF